MSGDPRIGNATPSQPALLNCWGATLEQRLVGLGPYQLGRSPETSADFDGEFQIPNNSGEKFQVIGWPPFSRFRSHHKEESQCSLML
tara:strand:- start:4671 stop:4931 length:261 start_codon:yes stop_codon:yes gene_type:complete